MNKKDIEAFAKEAAKGIKTPEDLNQFSQMLKKITVEAALNAEMDDHLGYEKHCQSSSINSRNGRTSKRIQTEDGQFALDTPRDRDGSFEPKLVKNHQSRFTSIDDKILWLYAQGMSTRNIVQAFDEWYGADISPTLVSRVTNAVLKQVVEWQSRPLDAIYPIVYLDCIVVKIRQDKRVINKSIFLALGINLDGHKELIYQSATEDEALLELDRFSDTWDGHYPQISKSWRNHWHNLNTFFNYPQDIRKAIYTTNAIESLNSVIRRALEKRKVFPNDDSAKKMVYLAIKEASKKWTMPIRNWRTAMNRFIIELEDRLEKHIN